MKNVLKKWLFSVEKQSFALYIFVMKQTLLSRATYRSNSSSVPCLRAGTLSDFSPGRLWDSNQQPFGYWPDALSRCATCRPISMSYVDLLLTWGPPRLPSPPRLPGAWPRLPSTPASEWAPGTWRARWGTASLPSGSQSGTWTTHTHT